MKPTAAVLKRSAAAVAVLVALVLAYAATRPDSFRVERRVSIAAAPEKVYPLLNDIRAQNRWSPWDKKDPAMKRVYSGAAAGVGAVYEWDGNKDIGAGRLEIVESIAPRKVVMRLDFTRPMEGRNVAAFTLEPQGAATEVTWSIEGPMPYVSKLFGLFCDMDTMIGKEFEAGLADLKSLAETGR